MKSQNTLKAQSIFLAMAVLFPASMIFAQPAAPSLSSPKVKIKQISLPSSISHENKTSKASNRVMLSISGANPSNSKKIVAAAKSAGAKRVKLNLEKGELKFSGKNIDRTKVKQSIEREVEGVNVKTL